MENIHQDDVDNKVVKKFSESMVIREKIVVDSEFLYFLHLQKPFRGEIKFHCSYTMDNS